jgi:hypothetical protein
VVAAALLKVGQQDHVCSRSHCGACAASCAGRGCCGARDARGERRCRSLVFGMRDGATLIVRRQPSSSTVQPFWKGARTSVGAIGVYSRITVAILQPR